MGDGRGSGAAPGAAGGETSELRASAIVVGGQRLIVLSLPRGEPRAPLTASEREVYDEVVRGRTNREIALARGTAERTVANQVASVMRKLGVGSRAELVARHFALGGAP